MGNTDLPGCGAPAATGSSAVLWVYAERYGRDSPGYRHIFKAASFSHSLSEDGRTGLVTLSPQPRILSVGGGLRDYECVRVFNDEGSVLGRMSRQASGEVAWLGSL